MTLNFTTEAPTGHNRTARGANPGLRAKPSRLALKVRNTLNGEDRFCYAPSGLINFSFLRPWVGTLGYRVSPRWGFMNC
jgi:hypothetical protein